MAFILQNLFSPNYLVEIFLFVPALHNLCALLLRGVSTISRLIPVISASGKLMLLNLRKSITEFYKTRYYKGSV